MTDNCQTIIRDLRHDFFAHRNGIVAARLRESGDPHSSIMGCLLADISTLVGFQNQSISDPAQQCEVAQQLWAITDSRECRLAAPMLMPPACTTLDLALQWSKSIETIEIADVLCHRLLRRLPFASELFNQLINSDQALTQYTGWRLLRNLQLLNKLPDAPSLKSRIQTQQSVAQPPLAALLNDILEDL